MAAPSLTRERVRELALMGRVVPDPSYHGQEHGVRFERLRTLLAFCQRVEPDRRPAHPRGHVAWCTNWGGEVYRIDFNLERRPDGDVILIVTGWRLEDD